MPVITPPTGLGPISALGLVLAAALLSPLALVGSARAQANDMFPTRAAAEQRARQLHCSGSFAMGREWMPCQNLKAYEQAVSRSS